MRTAGIIAEYNPFHIGHAYQIRIINEQLQPDFIVAVMSPDFVQRGSFALCSKYARTRMALLGGVDLVLELPVRFSTASAPVFAAGGVGLLDALGCVDDLVFGCETDHPEMLSLAAGLLASETPVFRDALRTALRSGMPFPAARERALRISADDSSLADALKCGLLSLPNNILAVEYLIALSSAGSHLKPFPVRRSGGDYHASSGASAEAIRRILFSGSGFAPNGSDREAAAGDVFGQIRDFIPDECFDTLKNELTQKGLPSRFLFDTMLHYRLLTEHHYDAFEDISPQLALRISNLLPSWKDGESFAASLKSRQYTRTHIDRALLHLFLGLRKKDAAPSVSYARILGFRRRAVPLLHRIKEVSRIPLISKCSSAETLLEPEAMEQFAEDISASHLYPLLSAGQAEGSGQKGEHEYTRSPIIINS